MDINETLIENIRSYIEKNLDNARYEHSLRVAKTALALCKKYGVDEEATYLAAISHDMCKTMDHDTLLLLAKEDGKEISELEKTKPSLLHGRAAAVKLSKDFGVQDKNILEAVSVHTFGKSGMGDIAKIVYVADKIEPGRSYITLSYMESLANLSLNNLVKTVLSNTILYLQKKGLEVAPDALDLLSYLEKNNVDEE